MTKYHARIAQIKAQKAVPLTQRQTAAVAAAVAAAAELAAIAALVKKQEAAKAAVAAEKKALRREVFLKVKASGIDTSRIRKRFSSNE